MTDYSYAVLYSFSCLGLIAFLHRWRRLSSLFIPLIYSLGCAITIASVFLGLYPSYVFILTAVILSGLVWGLRVADLPLAGGERQGFFLAVLLYLAFFSFQVQEDFIGGQDGRAVYLPMSRLLLEEPSMTLQRDYAALPIFDYYLGYPPFLTGMGSLLFNLTGAPRAEVAGLVPAIFFIGLIVLLLRWAEEEGVNLAVLAILLFLSPFFIEKLSWFYYEGPLAFGATLLAYALWRHSKSGEEMYLSYAMMGSALTLMSKYTGAFFTLLLMLYILKQKGIDKRVWGLFFAFHLVPVIWYARNGYYFGSPVPTYLSFLAEPRLREGWEANWLLAYKETHVEGYKRLLCLAQNSISIPLLFLWAISFPFSAQRGNIVYKGWYALFCVFLLFWLAQSPDMRYLLPFYGAAMVQLAIIFQEFLNQRGYMSLASAPGRQKMVLIVLFLLSLCGQYVYTRHIFPDHVSPALNAGRFLAEKEHAGPGTTVFTDTDHVLAWQFRWVVFEPSTVRLAPDFLEARREKAFTELMRKYKIQYVINHPWNSPWEMDFFAVIERDSQHFKEVYRDATSVRVWKVTVFGVH